MTTLDLNQLAALAKLKRMKTQLDQAQVAYDAQEDACIWMQIPVRQVAVIAGASPQTVWRRTKERVFGMAERETGNVA